MKKMNEIKNEKRLTKMFKPDTFYSLACDENCCPSWNDDDCNCERVLADRLAKYEDIGRDILNLPDDEVVPVEVLEMSLKVSSVFVSLSEEDILVKAVLDSVFAFIDKLYGKKAGEKNDKT